MTAYDYEYNKWIFGTLQSSQFILYLQNWGSNGNSSSLKRNVAKGRQPRPSAMMAMRPVRQIWRLN